MGRDKISDEKGEGEVRKVGGRRENMEKEKEEKGRETGEKGAEGRKGREKGENGERGRENGEKGGRRREKRGSEKGEKKREKMGRGKREKGEGEGRKEEMEEKKGEGEGRKTHLAHPSLVSDNTSIRQLVFGLNFTQTTTVTFINIRTPKFPKYSDTQIS